MLLPAHPFLLAATDTGMLLKGYSYAVPTGAISSITCDKPLATAQGDLLVAVMIHQGSASAWGGDTGWTEVIDQTSADPSLRIAWKVAGASEPANYTFTLAGGVSRVCAVIILRISGAQFDTVGTIAAGTGLSLALSGITAAEGFLFAVAGINALTTLTPPPGMASIAVANAGGSYPKLEIFMQEIAAGATGSRTVTLSNNLVRGGALFSVKKA